MPNTVWQAAQRKLKQLDLVARLEDLKILTRNDLHALKGAPARIRTWRPLLMPGWGPRHPGERSVPITFRWEGHDDFDVRCEDYH